MYTCHFTGSSLLSEVANLIADGVFTDSGRGGRVGEGI